MTSNSPDQFWKEYHQANDFERDKKIELIVKRLEDTCVALAENPELRKHAFTSFLRAYFDDLVAMIPFEEEGEEQI